MCDFLAMTKNMVNEDHIDCADCSLSIAIWFYENADDLIDIWCFVLLAVAPWCKNHSRMLHSHVSDQPNKIDNQNKNGHKIYFHQVGIIKYATNI